MKLTKTEGIVLLAAALLLAFTAGFFVGRGSVAASFTVETQRLSGAQPALAESAAASSDKESARAQTEPGEEAPAETAQAETGAVSTKTETSAAPAEAASAAAPETAAIPESEPAAQGKININTASAALLDTLPGIGEKRAQEIIKYRELHGSFRYIEQIVDVPGIGEGIYKNIADLITV